MRSRQLGVARVRRAYKADAEEYRRDLRTIKRRIQEIDDLLVGIPGGRDARRLVSELEREVSRLPK